MAGKSDPRSSASLVAARQGLQKKTDETAARGGTYLPTSRQGQIPTVMKRFRWIKGLIFLHRCLSLG